MKICCDGHDEVCFDGGACPMCQKEKEIAEKENLIIDLENRIKELEEENSKLADSIE